MGGRILVVDDEHALLDLLQRYLIRLGYSVDVAGTVAEAWSKFEQDSSYLLAMVDLTLPDGSGEQLMHKMLVSNDAVRILLFSGYPYETEQVPLPVRRRIAFIQKPFLPRQLADQLTKLLANR